MKCDLALVAIGSNLPGEARNSLETCISTLALIESPDVRILRCARWRRSAAYPAGSGPDFVNGAIALETSLTAADLLSRLHGVEAKLGRERRVRWGPRVCDLDLIGYADEITPDTETLRRLMREGATSIEAPDEMILPHPRMHERAFVLEPLADIAPDWRHPVLGQTVAEMLAKLPAALRAEVTVLEKE